MTPTAHIILPEIRKDDILAELERRREPIPIDPVHFKEDPFGFTLRDFRWGLSGVLERFEGPDKWQREFLEELGEQVKARKFDGYNPVDPIKMTRSAGKGVGKSVIVALLTNWIMKCWPYCNGTVTANTFSQLDSKTWATIQHWLKLSKSSGDFIIGGSAVRHRIYGKSWQCTAQTCREENCEAFAGQHAANSVGFYIFDESSGIPEKIWETAISGMMDGMPMIFAFGNSTRPNGRFFRINFGDERGRWNNGVIDGRESMITNKKTIAEDIEYYGDDSDYVRVYIKGLPPKGSDMQFIDSAKVYAAQDRLVEVLEDEPLIAGVDLARGGGDKAVVRFRRGDDARSIPPVKIPAEQTKDSMLLVAKLADMATQKFGNRKVDVWFLDGGGVGGPIIDRMKQLGHTNFIEIQFGAECPDSKHYANMRSWMWSKMRDALGTRLAIDKDKDLETDLTSVGLGKQDKLDRILLESKVEMKKRGLDSPDDADALALTYARQVAPLPKQVATLPKIQFREGRNAGVGWMAS